MSGILNIMLALQTAIVELGGNKTVTSIGGGGSGFAQVSLTNTGLWSGQADPNPSGEFSSTWITPTSAAPGSYEVRSTVNSGAFTTDPSLGFWIPLSSTRLWDCVGTAVVNATFEIRLAGVVLDSCTVILDGS